jgi:tRNA (mo5U34)-methyltransferase
MDAAAETREPAPGDVDVSDLRAAIASRPVWYHTMEIAPGVVTPGWFDLRGIVDRMPWPDVRGKRCLDVGPYDGFLSFELERRGAAEVVATDISHPAEWDWPLLMRDRGHKVLAEIAGTDPGAGLRIARDAMGSSVERVEVSVYDLTPERVGMFDVVVCGSLLLHLRDPIRGLEAIHGVCREAFLSAEQLSAGLSLLSRRRPLARNRGGVRCQWWIPNVAAHRLMVESAGFEIERSTRPYAIPLGPGHPHRGKLGTLQAAASSVALTGHIGLPHAAVLATPKR